MAQCKQSAPEFIQNTFSPHVAVLCSADAENLCQKNNLTFAQLVQPFCRLGTEVHIKDPNNASHSIHNLRIGICDMAATPPQQATAKKMLSDAVAGSQLQTGDSGRGAGHMMSVGNYDLQLHASTPWYEAYRECFLDVLTPSDHEYLNHCVGCIFVVSSSHTDPIATFTGLTNQQLQQQQQFPNKVPRWFCPGILTYYVLLHDVSDGELPRAEAYYQSMKTTFGTQCCHLLQVNSRSLQTVENMKPEASLPDPWSQFLPKPAEVQPAKSHTPRYFITWEGVEYDGLPQDDVSFPSHLSEARLTATVPDLDASIISETTPDVISDKLTSVDSSSLTDLSSLNTSSNDLTSMDHPLAFHASESQPQLEEPNVSLDGDATAAANGYQDGRNTGGLVSGQEKTKLRSHGICLTTSDMDRLRIFMHEFVVRALIPWAEKQMRMLNDQLTSRKGIHRSIFSATKKWFGSNKGSGPVQASQNTSVVYTSEAPELQLRRLADLAFLFQMYDYGYHTYHTAKRDFNNDHAWLHFAGALEMASLSIFMLGSQSQRQYPHHYMESAITTYLTTCRNFQYAIRATLASTEALKCRGMYGEAAMQFLKMTNEDSDLSSALFLEQAAHCFINMKTPMVRKYAFHMILAGHRFNKSGQRKHSLRAYSQALQVFKSKHWTLAEDHIHFTIGRQSFNLKQLENASSAFKHLLMAESKQPAAQQGAFLREYLFVYKQLLNQEAGENCSYGRLPELPLPNLNSNTTKVLLGKQMFRDGEKNVRKTSASGVWFDHDESRNVCWQKLEEKLVMSSNNGTLPITFRPTLQCFTNNTDNKSSPVAFVGEPIVVEVQVSNPLQVTLVQSDVMLLWSFLPSIAGADKPQLISNEISTGVKNNLADEIIQTTVIKEVVLEGGQTSPIHLTLVPRQPGELRVVGLAYNLGTTSSQSSQPPTPLPSESLFSGQKPSFISSVYVRGKQRLEVQGPRLNNNKDEKTSKVYGADRRLDLVVHEEMPILEVSFCDFPDSLLCGEVHCIEMEVKNTGRSPLHRLKVTSTHFDFFTFGLSRDLPKYPYVYQMRSSDSDCTNPVDSCNVCTLPDVIDIPIEGGVLRPGDTMSLPMWLRGNDIGGVHEVDFLFYYEPVNMQAKDRESVRHRILRHRAVINTVESLSVRAQVTRPSACVSGSDGQELNSCIISCELENLSQVQVQRPHIQELQVTQVSCASQDWIVNSLSISEQKDIRIGSRHILQFALKGTKCQSDGKLKFSEVSFDIQKINSVQTPCCDFYYRSPACRPNSTPPDDVPPVSSVRFSERDQQDFCSLNKAREVKLTLIFLWKAFVAQENGQLKILVGQHHVCIEKVDTVVTAFPLVMSNQDQPPLKFIRNLEPKSKPQPSPEVTTKLVSYSFLHELNCTHDFSKGLCIVPVMLKLQNHTDTSVDVLVDTSKSSDRFGSSSSSSSPTPPQFSPGSPHQPVMSCSFSWVGPTLTNLTLEPGTHHELKLKAAFCRAGVYNFNNLAVFVTYADADPSEMILQKHSTPSIITLSA